MIKSTRKSKAAKLESVAPCIGAVFLACCGTDSGSGPDVLGPSFEEGRVEVAQLLENDIGPAIVTRYVLPINGISHDSAMVVEGVASACNVVIPSAVVEFQNDSSMAVALDIVRDCEGTAQDHSALGYQYSASFQFVRHVYEVQFDLCDPWESCFDLTTYGSDGDPHPIVESARVGFSFNRLNYLSPAPFCVATNVELTLRLRDPQDYLLDQPKPLTLVFFPDPALLSVVVGRVQFGTSGIFESCRDST